MAGIATTNGFEMKLAFVLYKYFPFGGLQRDMLQIAGTCRARGHEIHIYTLSWEGERPDDMTVHVLPVKRWSNHEKYRVFRESLDSLFEKQGIDRVVGFNKMPGLDYYYAADPCLKDKLVSERGPLVRLLPRYRHFLGYEAAVFGRESNTQILLISPRQHHIYQKYYSTSERRLHMLPPGIDRSRMAGHDAEALRKDLRREFNIADDECLILCIGSGFKTKGLDRSLKAFAALPPGLQKKTCLIAIGSDNGDRFVRLAGKLGVKDRFRVLHGRDDIPRFLQGGDLLLHPAYYENSGMVILEAIIAGLPPLVSSVCGYAYYVEEAQAGRVLSEPFQQEELNQRVAEMLESPQRSIWRENGISYGQQHDLYSMTEHAADLILSP
jgi:UDP-glucose:(heptosyl)LPS alpha-1,3-glucosyltransferase